MIEIKEVLRLWLAGQSLREVTRLPGWTARRSAATCEAAQACRAGPREGDQKQLTDELLGAVVAVVRPERPRGNGAVLGGHRRTA